MPNGFVTPFVPGIYTSPNTIPITDLIARQGADAAAARERQGQITGDAFNSIGQTIANLPVRIAQAKAAGQEAQQRQMEIDAATANQQGLTHANQIVSSLMTTNADGSRTVDRTKAQQAMASANVPLPVQQSVFKALDDTDASIQKFTAAKTDHRADLAHSAITMIDAGLDPHVAVATAAQLAHGNGLTSDAEIGQFMDGLSNVDPSQIRSVLAGVRANSEKYKDVDKPIVVPKDATVITPSGKQLAAGKAGAPTAEEAQLGAYLGSLNVAPGTKWEDLTSQQRAAFPAWQHAQTVEPPKPGTVEDFVARARRIAVQQNGGQPLSDQQQAATDSQAMAHFRTVNTDPELRAARMALDAATLAAKDPNGAVNQEKLEKAYQTALLKPLSSRSGGLGLEDQKVNQAIHLKALLDQAYDPKTGQFNVPKVQLNELALGLARLVSPTGSVGEGMMNDLNQRTAKGDVAGVLTYLTGTPVTGNTQAVIKMFRDSILRQGKVAEGNRQTYLDAIKALAPTDLADDRRAKVEQALKLNTIDAPLPAPAGQTSMQPVPAGQMRIYGPNGATALGPAGTAIPAGWSATPPQ